MNYSTSAPASSGYAPNNYAHQTGSKVDNAPPQPTRFSGFAGQLEVHVAHLATLFDRVSRVADRLGGSVPEETSTANKIRGNGSCIAVQFEVSLEDLDAVTRRAEHIVSRLETL